MATATEIANLGLKGWLEDQDIEQIAKRIELMVAAGRRYTFWEGEIGRGVCFVFGVEVGDSL